MSNTLPQINVTACANCGKGEEASAHLKSCNACMMVKYCSRECQITHRPQHKKECKKRAAKLHDEKLFKQPPPLEDCPICMIRLPTLVTGQTYMNCCGKIICTGCIHAVKSRATKKEHDVCPFCRTSPHTSKEEYIKQYKKRIELNDSEAMYSLGCHHRDGDLGLPQDISKALELWHRAGKLGHADSNYVIGGAYMDGNGVELNKKEAIKYWELSAMGGCIQARHNLGVAEWQKGNVNRALGHYMIAVKDGNTKSLESIKHMCKAGFARKEVYAHALQSYKAYLDEIKTAQRDEAGEYI